VPRASIYFAGPDVFRPDYPLFVARVKALCAGLGLTPLLPGDGGHGAADSQGIFRHNLNLIRGAAGVVANLDPFRGPVEPDSGTVFECAYAFALGKFVIGVMADGRDLLTKLRALGLGPAESGRPAPDGWLVEDFGLPLNLMLAHGLSALVPTLEEAAAAARRLSDPQRGGGPAEVL
jgi:nucleoside 2-deoxyribosyltransferase